jgi:hypothetical protein
MVAAQPIVKAEVEHDVSMRSAEKVTTCNPSITKKIKGAASSNYKDFGHQQTVLLNKCRLFRAFSIS